PPSTATPRSPRSSSPRSSIPRSSGGISTGRYTPRSGQPTGSTTITRGIGSPSTGSARQPNNSNGNRTTTVRTPRTPTSSTTNRYSPTRVKSDYSNARKIRDLTTPGSATKARPTSNRYQPRDRIAPTKSPRSAA